MGRRARVCPSAARRRRAARGDGRARPRDDLVGRVGRRRRGAAGGARDTLERVAAFRAHGALGHVAFSACGARLCTAGATDGIAREWSVDALVAAAARAPAAGAAAHRARRGAWARGASCGGSARRRSAASSATTSRAAARCSRRPPCRRRASSSSVTRRARRALLPHRRARLPLQHARRLLLFSTQGGGVIGFGVSTRARLRARAYRPRARGADDDAYDDANANDDGGDAYAPTTRWLSAGTDLRVLVWDSSPTPRPTRRCRPALRPCAQPRRAASLAQHAGRSAEFESALALARHGGRRRRRRAAARDDAVAPRGRVRVAVRGGPARPRGRRRLARARSPRPPSSPRGERRSGARRASARSRSATPRSPRARARRRRPGARRDGRRERHGRAMAHRDAHRARGTARRRPSAALAAPQHDGALPAHTYTHTRALRIAHRLLLSSAGALGRLLLVGVARDELSARQRRRRRRRTTLPVHTLDGAHASARAPWRLALRGARGAVRAAGAAARAGSRGQAAAARAAARGQR